MIRGDEGDEGIGGGVGIVFFGGGGGTLYIFYAPVLGC